jgi:hypothetical protein
VKREEAIAGRARFKLALLPSLLFEGVEAHDDLVQKNRRADPVAHAVLVKGPIFREVEVRTSAVQLDKMPPVASVPA